MDDELYFEEQLERIYTIRVSARKFYQKLTDLYAATSLDYDPLSAMAKRFFDSVLNRIQYAIQGNRTLTTFEAGQLERLMSAYLDFGQSMMERNIALTMEDWENRFEGLFKLFDEGLLADEKKVSEEIAKLSADTESKQYRIIQDRHFESDYDKYIRSLKNSNNY